MAGGTAMEGASSPPAAPAVDPASLDPVERELLGRALTEEGALAEVAARGGSGCFRSEALRALVEPWIGAARAPRPEELHELALTSALARALLAELPHEHGRTVEMSRREARDLIQRLEERRLKASIQTLDQAIREAERSRDEGSLGRLIAERRDLTSRLHARSHTAVG
jgi:hypothetical protein